MQLIVPKRFLCVNIPRQSLNSEPVVVLHCGKRNKKKKFAIVINKNAHPNNINKFPLLKTCNRYKANNVVPSNDIMIRKETKGYDDQTMEMDIRKTIASIQ